jgi:hypothetical protein
MPTSVAVSDLDNNGFDDLIVSCTGANKIHVVKNNGFPNVAEFDLPTEMAPRNMSLTDVNGDGINDLVVPCKGSNTVDFFLNKQGAGLEGVTYFSKSTSPCQSPYQTQILDVDGDGKSDVGVAGLGSGTQGCISVLFNQSM